MCLDESDLSIQCSIRFLDRVSRNQNRAYSYPVYEIGLLIR